MYITVDENELIHPLTDSLTHSLIQMLPFPLGNEGEFFHFKLQTRSI